VRAQYAGLYAVTADPPWDGTCTRRVVISAAEFYKEDGVIMQLCGGILLRPIRQDLGQETAFQAGLCRS
jgi:hypothetical protein